MTNSAGSRGKDHPRACGENSFVKFPSKMSLGSPPRVRGKLYLLRDSLDRIGITPARAGKTLPAPVCIRRRRDHPRACGENVTNSGTAGAAVGSPPRVRGKHDLITTRIREIRITPARAGKTRCTPGPCQSHRDHPRACGENCSITAQRVALIGSPPRVRGKLDGCALLSPIQRITPARAGKTSVSSPGHTAF